MASKYRKLQNKHVLVIGGTSGIGFAVAEGSLASRASVTVSSSNQSRVDSAVQKLKASFPQATVAGFTCDLSKPTVEQDVEALFGKVGKVDHIVYTGLYIAARHNGPASAGASIGKLRFYSW